MEAIAYISQSIWHIYDIYLPIYPPIHHLSPNLSCWFCFSWKPWRIEKAASPPSPPLRGRISVSLIHTGTPFAMENHTLQMYPVHCRVGLSGAPCSNNSTVLNIWRRKENAENKDRKVPRTNVFLAPPHRTRCLEEAKQWYIVSILFRTDYGQKVWAIFGELGGDRINQDAEECEPSGSRTSLPPGLIHVPTCENAFGGSSCTGT